MSTHDNTFPSLSTDFVMTKYSPPGAIDGIVLPRSPVNVRPRIGHPPMIPSQTLDR
jgi:hypothetical protein